MSLGGLEIERRGGIGCMYMCNTYIQRRIGGGKEQDAFEIFLFFYFLFYFYSV